MSKPMSKPAARPPTKQPVFDTPVPKGFNQLLEKLNDIPTLPIVASKVNELINNPNSSAGDIAAILKKDQVLTAKVLKLINSPYYGIPGEVTDVRRALAFLGFNTLAQLVLGLSVFSLFPTAGTDEFPMLEFWRHALATAVCAEVIAKRVKYAKPEECFTCGLLHDIGKIVMYEVAKDTMLNVVKYAKEKQCSFVEAESALDVPNHAFLGEYIAAKWGLPSVIRSAIRYHHFDVSVASTILPGTKPAIYIVSLANALVVNLKIGQSGDCSDGGLQPYMYESLGLKTGDLEQIKAQTLEEMKKAGSFLTARNL
ncbi:MAG: HDOD domain-containing protein [Deltaproteobacteria bacterium]|nr:HDOD domain-containing protein [Deltaproteobacteria bacterium]